MAARAATNAQLWTRLGDDPAAVEQFCRPSRAISPERALLLAVFADALRCYRGQACGSRSVRLRAQKDAAKWFGANTTKTPFHFVALCEVFGWSVTAIRAVLRGPCRNKFGLVLVQSTRTMNRMSRPVGGRRD